MKLKLKKNSSIRSNGLYDLEEILGECSGHGCGFGGEDIDWKIFDAKDGKSWNVLDICEEDGWLNIRYLKFYNDIEMEPKSLGLSKLPKEWLEGVQEIIKKHCSNEKEDILI